MDKTKMADKNGTEKEIIRLGLSGTCYWCMEAIFQSLIGVIQVSQGWISLNHTQESNIEKTSKSNNSLIHQAINQQGEFFEAILIDFDPSEIPLEVIVEIHLATHQSSKQKGEKLNQLKQRYPSGIYVFNRADKVKYQPIIEAKLNKIQAQLNANLQTDKTNPLILFTQLKQAYQFHPSEDEKQNYYYNHPQKPFCELVIAPKLKWLLDTYNHYTLQEKISDLC